MTSSALDRPRRRNRRIPPPTRFWAKVDVRGPNDCWPWMAGTSNGYGSFRIEAGHTISAHRFAKWDATGEPCPDGMLPQHTCKTPESGWCCNPAHVVYAPPGSLSTIRRGQNHHAAKLTDADVRQIRARYAAGGTTHQQLADEYGVTPPHITGIISGRQRADA